MSYPIFRDIKISLFNLFESAGGVYASIILNLGIILLQYGTCSIRRKRKFNICPAEFYFGINAVGTVSLCIKPVKMQFVLNV